MSCILYYSTYCPNSKTLLQQLSNSSIKDDIHFINIDNRITKEDGTIFIVLQDGQELILPPTVNKVPALLLLNRGHQVIFGDKIQEYLNPKMEVLTDTATQNNGEPLAYSLNGGSTQGFGVASDSFSFLDQAPEDLTAKGEGGLRQRHHYATLNTETAIETPPDTYTPDKVKDDTCNKYIASRNSDQNLATTG